MSVTRWRQRLRGPVVAGLAGLLLVVSLLALGIGAVHLSLGEVWGILGGKLGLIEATPWPNEAVLWHLRLPRVLFGILVGATLAVTGVLMQGMFRNPLADPGLVGVSSGAALGAVVIIVFGQAFFPSITWLSDYRLLPLAAFVGALGVTFLIERIASTSGYTAVATLLLAGVAMNAIVGAIIGLSTFVATDIQMRTLQFWTLGSLGAASWKVLLWAAPLCLLTLALAPLFAPLLNALSLGEAEAEHLGFNVERSKRWLILVTAAGVGACVAFSGIIGFVGLVIPHLVRIWIGPDHRWLIPGSALMGAILLVTADLASRTMVAPAELPIGILTAAFGGPFFLFMLLQARRRALWG